jgi:hypothetical protein
MNDSTETQGCEPPSQRDKLLLLASRGCDQPLAEGDRVELARLLDADRSLIREYVDFVTTESLIERSCGLALLERSDDSLARDLISASGDARSSGGRRDRPHPAPAALRPAKGSRTPSWSVGSVWKRPTFAYSVAASLVTVAAATAFLLARGPVARVSAVDNAVLVGGAAVNIGQSGLDRWTELARGVVSVSLRQGAVAAIDAPARFRVTSGNSLEINHGVLTAQVPTPAQGFTVSAPIGRVIDLGTGFRLVAAERGGMSLHVTQGAVLLDANGSDPLQIAAGQRAAVNAAGEARVLGDKPRCTGAFGFVESHPTSLGYKAHVQDGRASVFLESHDVRLLHDLRVDLSSPGRHTTLETEDATIPEGSVVDCYLIHCAPVAERHEVAGAVRFPGRIVGVLCGDDRLNATNAELGARWSLACQHPERGVESLPDPNADTITISRDRRTLSAHFQTMSIDQVRVLVETMVD